MKRTMVYSLVASVLLLGSSCSSDDDDGAVLPDTTRAPVTAAPTTQPVTVGPAVTDPDETVPEATETVAVPSTEAAVDVLQILVTNDDGIGAPGIDALVNALLAIPVAEVTVVAPAENQSGTSMSLTDGVVVSTETATAGGHPAVAVEGFPADSVSWAFANFDTDFDLVVSGSNSGQNIGPFTELSGTVGAARYAAQQGVAGVAVSQGLVEGDIDFTDSVTATVEWITPRVADFESGEVSLTGINAATCDGGNRGVVEVPLATDFAGRDAFVFDCDSTLMDPVDDVDAFANGFTAVSDLPVQP